MIAPSLWVAAIACWSTAVFVGEHCFGIDEIASSGLAAGVAAIGWWRLRRGAPAAAPSSAWLAVAAIAFVAFGCAYVALPRLVGQAILVVGVAATAIATLPPNRRHRAWAIGPLLLLALPVLPSLQYVFGFPLRLTAAWIGALWLGPEIEAIGTGMTDGVNTVFVDGPCSGLRMLWVLGFLASASALWLAFALRRTVALLAIALGIATLANAIRACTLFILETRLANLAAATPWLHDVVGVTMFVCACVALLAVVRRLDRPTHDRAAGDVSPGIAARPLVVTHALAALVAAVVPATASAGSAVVAGPIPDFAFPSTWLGRPLHATDEQPSLANLAHSFPGRVREFRIGDGAERILFRWTPRATRHLHEASTCLRGVGARIEPMAPWVDADGHRWSRFRATHRDGRVVTVRQCYFALPPDVDGDRIASILADAHSWPDAAAWYWHAARPGSSVTSTLAITIAESSPRRIDV